MIPSSWYNVAVRAKKMMLPPPCFALDKFLFFGDAQFGCTTNLLGLVSLGDFLHGLGWFIEIGCFSLRKCFSNRHMLLQLIGCCSRSLSSPWKLSVFLIILHGGFVPILFYSSDCFLSTSEIPHLLSELFQDHGFKEQHTTTTKNNIIKKH